jgi:transposase
VRTLFEQGLSQRAIARTLKLSRATVGKFVQAEAYPEMHHSARGARGSLLDPYKRYLLQRWQHGCRNGVQLYDEITARGYKGSAPLLRLFLTKLRKKHQEAGSASVLTFDPSTQAIEIPSSLPPKPHIPCRMSATRASWLFVSQAGKLDEKQTRHVEHI